MCPGSCQAIVLHTGAAHDHQNQTLASSQRPYCFDDRSSRNKHALSNYSAQQACLVCSLGDAFALEITLCANYTLLFRGVYQSVFFEL